MSDTCEGLQERSFTSWGEVFRYWRRRGEDLAYCAVKADQWERKRITNSLKVAKGFEKESEAR